MDPILCYDDGKTRKFRHFSLSSGYFRLIHNKVFNCGKCIFCRQRNARELAMRCVLHASLYTENSFLTLTYDETKKDYHNELEYKDIQDFKKRLRRHCEYHHEKRVQIFNVHEYGKNGKKHWHLVVFNHDFPDRQVHTIRSGNTLYTSDVLNTLWVSGFHTIGSVTEASAMYQAQYMQKDLKNGNLHNSKKSNSKHSGIGRDYFNRHYKQILTLGFIPFGGKKVPIPRYFIRIAHKHYSHFYEPHNFFDHKNRKKLYNPFKNGEENKEIADLFKVYREHRRAFIHDIAEEWEKEMSQFIFNDDKPDFLLSGENYIYDLRNRNNNTNKDEF